MAAADDLDGVATIGPAAVVARPRAGLAERVSVLVCRGCCCGTEDKHPGVDHAGQLRVLRAALAGNDLARLWEVDCLGPCSRSNVVVVRRGGRRRWFGEVLAEEDTAALAGWVATAANSSLPLRLAAREFSPDTTALALVPDPRRGDELADLVESILARAGGDGSGAVGSWVLGVEGAVAEFTVDGDDVVAGRDGRSMSIATARGAVKLRVTDEALAFVASTPGPDGPAAPVVHALVLAVPRAGLAGAPGEVTDLGHDEAAVHASDAGGVLVDLGLGRAGLSFCVRAVDESLVGLLRAVEGLPWPEALDRIGERMFELSPTRVVQTALGRAEVRTPIPRPGAASPPGPHTHLLPALLEVGRELPVGLVLPPDFTPAATYYPPPGWHLP